MNEWKYTQEQARAIKNGDINARNAFYMDNYARIEIMARAYVARGRAIKASRFCSFEDLIHQVYLDLPLFNFDTPQNITFSLKCSSFYLCGFGGWSYFVENGRNPHDYERFRGDCISIESKDESDRPLVDVFVSSPSTYEEYEKREREKTDYSAILRTIFEKYVSKRQTDFLALWCDGYSDTEAANKIGTTIYNVHKKKAFDRLRVNYADIVDTLCASGCDTAYDYILLSPALLEQSQRALTATPEQKAKAAAHMRERRAKLKAKCATV